MILLTNTRCFCPRPMGCKDILIAGGKIEAIRAPGELAGLAGVAEVFPCDGLSAFPGIIDQHVHIIGGGGEEGPQSCIGEIGVEETVRAGITTVVGVLGADSCTKTPKRLLMKARALQAQGITAYMYTGSYASPAPTITGSITDDLVCVEQAIGTGEVAISDHRSTLFSPEAFCVLAAQTHVGGLLGGKAGVVHIHVGDGRDALAPLLEVLGRTDLPMEMFVPTHVNRSRSLLRDALRYCKSGGSIDLTAGETAGVPVPEALRQLMDAGVDMARVTVSSDANGSIPGGGTAAIGALLEDIRTAILVDGIAPEAAFALVTENVARVLKLPHKGVLREGADADILLVDGEYRPAMVVCRGRILFKHGMFTGGSI